MARASGPGEALLICEQHSGPIDLLLSDVVMPRMNGYQFCRELRAKDAETFPLLHPEYYRYDFDLPAISELWRRGSVIGSWLLDLTAAANFNKTKVTKTPGLPAVTQLPEPAFVSERITSTPRVITSLSLIPCLLGATAPSCGPSCGPSLYRR